jgi:hypothetical protein
MPYGLNVANGNPPTGYSSPVRGNSFLWLNYDTSTSVNISNAGNWCTPGNCTVPAATGVAPNITPGSFQAQVLTMPNNNGCAFGSTGWNVPGMPHVGNPPMPTPLDEPYEGEEGREKEVA